MYKKHKNVPMMKARLFSCTSGSVSTPIRSWKTRSTAGFLSGSSLDFPSTDLLRNNEPYYGQKLEGIKISKR